MQRANPKIVSSPGRGARSESLARQVPEEIEGHREGRFASPQAIVRAGWLTDHQKRRALANWADDLRQRDPGQTGLLSDIVAARVALRTAAERSAMPEGHRPLAGMKNLTSASFVIAMGLSAALALVVMASATS